MMNKKGIALAGCLINDRIYSINSYPAVGTLTKIISIENAVGGLVPNDALDLKKLSPF